MTEPRHIIHVDMDAFYASVEKLDDPGLEGKPVIVGGDPKARGVVSAASYEARKYGVHSAMPMAQAIRLCPHAVVLPGRMDRYCEVSRRIRAIFESYTSMVEPLSLDEAFLDVTGSLRLFGAAAGIGRAIKARIKDQLRLTASVGVAPNKFLAKLASDLEKPDGFVVITEENCQQILDPLPVGRIWGIGKITQKALEARGIHTIAQFRQTPLKHLEAILGNSAYDLLQLARGIDDRPVEPYAQARSMSSEHTFPKDIADIDVLLGVLLNQVEEVAQRLRGEDLVAKTLTLKLRYGDFTTITRAETLEQPSNTTRTLWLAAEAIFRHWHTKSGQPLRLLGFSASKLTEHGLGQMSLFSNPEDEKQRKLDEAVDQIRKRYGDDVIKRGAQT